jgi:Uma2 family endonuclease
MPVSEQTYERVALEDPDGNWELHCGQLRSKPGMTAAHNRIGRVLGYRLQQQLPLDVYEVSVDAARVRISERENYIPDVVVLPTAAVEAMEREHPTRLEAYREPMPLIVEVWSPSTGAFDVQTKVPDYQRRGDLEIWRLHRDERTLRAWVRQPDGGYVETVYTGGVVRPSALPNVSIDLDELFSL